MTAGWLATLVTAVIIVIIAGVTLGCAACYRWGHQDGRDYERALRARRDLAAAERAALRAKTAEAQRTYGPLPHHILDALADRQTPVEVLRAADAWRGTTLLAEQPAPPQLPATRDGHRITTPTLHAIPGPVTA